MTEPNFRALCAEIYQEFSSLYCDMSACVDFNDSYMERIDNLCNRADAALATVPPEQKNSIDELIAGCKPLDPEMAEALTTEARWRLFGEDNRDDLPPHIRAKMESDELWAAFWLGRSNEIENT